MKTITIEGQLRTDTGKKATRQYRSQGLVPGVIYGGKQEVSFVAPLLAFKSLVYTPDFQLAEIKLNGNSHKCIMKDLQFDPINDRLAHADFLELREDRKVIADIPLKFSGIPEGVKEGGKLITKMKSLKVKTLPKYLRENIQVDLTKLQLHANIRVEDVQVEHYEILNSPRIPIASVVTTRQLKVDEATTPGAAPAAGAAAPAPAAGATPAPAAPAGGGTAGGKKKG